MTESDLSSEVNAVTSLPSPSSINLGGVKDGFVVSWSNDDDSSDGGVTVERSSDGGSTWTGVASGLSPSTTSYTDTVPSDGSYMYRVKRSTDHATATSGTISGEIQSRQSQIELDNISLKNTRKEAAVRQSIVNPDLSLTNTRTTTQQRSSEVDVDASLTNARQVGRDRRCSISVDCSLNNTRLSAYKPRHATTEGDIELENIAVFRETFPSELTRDLQWEYSHDRQGFESSWLYQEGSDGAGSVALYLEGTFGNLDPCTPTAVIDFDRDGDGEFDERSQARPIPAADKAVVFPELSGESGYYRVLLRDLRPADILTAVTFGPTHT